MEQIAPSSPFVLSPAAQNVHESMPLAPGKELLPAGQSEHEPSPIDAVYLPEIQGVHADCPFLPSVDWPTEHVTLVVDFAVAA